MQLLHAHQQLLAILLLTIYVLLLLLGRGGCTVGSCVWPGRPVPARAGYLARNRLPARATAGARTLLAALCHDRQHPCYLLC
jgi:hypothetical protein